MGGDTFGLKNFANGSMQKEKPLERQGQKVPSWAAETADFKAFSVSVVGFCENACAALLALAALETTPPAIAEVELKTALELAAV